VQRTHERGEQESESDQHQEVQEIQRVVEGVEFELLAVGKAAYVSQDIEVESHPQVDFPEVGESGQQSPPLSPLHH